MTLEIRPLHRVIQSSRQGLWWSLPGANWQVQIWADRLIFSDQHLLSWLLPGWIEQWGVDLDLMRGYIDITLIGSNHCLLRWRLRVDKKGGALLEMRRSSRGSWQVKLDGQPLLLHPRQRLFLSSAHPLDSEGLSALEATGRSIELWMGSNQRLDWDRLLEQLPPAALAHQWILALRWWRDPGEQVDCPERERLTGTGSRWPERWRQLVREGCRGPFALHPAGWSSSSSGDPGWGAKIAHLWLERWYRYQEETGRAQLQLCSRASSQMPSGYLIEQLGCGGSWRWHWRAQRHRVIELHSKKVAQLRLELDPAPKQLRLTQPGGASRLIGLEGKVLDLELLPDAHYRLDRLHY